MPRKNLKSLEREIIGLHKDPVLVKLIDPALTVLHILDEVGILPYRLVVLDKAIVFRWRHKSVSALIQVDPSGGYYLVKYGDNDTRRGRSETEAQIMAAVRDISFHISLESTSNISELSFGGDNKSSRRKKNIQ